MFLESWPELLLNLSGNIYLMPASLTFRGYSRQQDAHSGRWTCQGTVIQTFAAGGIKGNLRGRRDEVKDTAETDLSHHKNRKKNRKNAVL